MLAFDLLRGEMVEQTQHAMQQNSVLPAAELLVGVSDSIFNVSQVSLRQSVTPDRLQGRMTATLRTMFWGAWPIANLAGGILAGAVGAPTTIFISGLDLMPSRKPACRSWPGVDVCNP